MIIARRDFLRLLGVTVGAVGLGGCTRDWLVPDDLVELAQRGPGVESFAQTVCGLCEGRCGLTVRLVDGLPVGLKGNPRHPLNRGGLCPVGQGGLEVLYAPNRLQSPLRRGADGALHPVGWDEALDEIAERLRRLAAAGDGHRVALLTEEPSELFLDLARRFLHALGSPNLGRPQDAAALTYRLMQGLDSPPGVDLAGTDLVLSFGLDLFEDGPAPVHAISALVGSRATGERAALIHVGTRMSPSSSKAEERVVVRPGTHAALALGLAHVLVREGHYDRRFVAEHTAGFEDWTDRHGRRRTGFRRLLLERYYPDRAARMCGCDPARIIQLGRRLARAGAPVAVVGGEAVCGANATWTVMAVHALNALTGSFNRPGGVVLAPPIPLTPLEPLPELSAGEGRDLFSPRPGGAVFGIAPVAALAEGGDDGSAPVEVLLVAGSNPLHGSPAAGDLRRAMARIPMVVACAPFLDDTAAAADLVLPSPVFFETWEAFTTPATVAFSVVGLAHPVVEPLFDSRHAGDVLLELARRVGAPVDRALPWEGYPAYLRHRLDGLAASGQGTVISGSFEESWVHFLEERGWRFLEQGSSEEFWTDLAREGGWWNPELPRDDWSRLFATPSGRFEFHSSVLEERLRELGAAAGRVPAESDEALARAIAALGLEADLEELCLPHFEPPRALGQGDLVAIPFRPMTSRGALAAVSPMVLEMFGYPLLTGWETWAELSPETAREMDLADGDRVSLEAAGGGAVEAVIRVRPGGADGVVHLPLGLGHRDLGGAAAGIGSNPLDVLAGARDPLSGALSPAPTRVEVRLIERRRHGAPVPLEGGPA
jgi:anaerobic selenocysteine-containing dehydrogenase